MFKSCSSIWLIALVAICTSQEIQAQPSKTPKLKSPIIGIIVPLADESEWLRQQIQHRKPLKISGVSYETGTINGQSVVLALSGLGQVNAGIIAARMITDFHPTQLFLSGSAGNINPQLAKGDVVIGKTVVNVDLGVYTEKGVVFEYPAALLSPQTQQVLPLVFELPSGFALLPKIKLENNKVILGNIATSDALPNLEPQWKLLQQNHMDVVEMEGAAVMQACWLLHTPCMVIRGISNQVKESITIEDTKHAGDNAARVLVQVMQKK